jgi:hypothetical protein
VRQVALDYISDHPRRATMAVGARLGRITGVFHPLQQGRFNALIAGREEWIASSTMLIWYPSAVLAVVGAILLRRRSVPILALMGLVAVALIATAMTLAVLRYRAPMEPAIAVLAAVAFERLWLLVKNAWSDDGPVSV